MIISFYYLSCKDKDQSKTLLNQNLQDLIEFLNKPDLKEDFKTDKGKCIALSVIFYLGLEQLPTL